jgi:hypothetical protein
MSSYFIWFIFDRHGLSTTRLFPFCIYWCGRLKCTFLDMIYDIYIMGPNVFKNLRSLKILGIRRVIWDSFHFGEPKICSTIGNSVARPTRRLVFLEPWFKLLSNPSNNNRWHMLIYITLCSLNMGSNLSVISVSSLLPLFVTLQTFGPIRNVFTGYYHHGT